MLELPKTIVCDIDGTISTRCDRDYYDLSKVIHDHPLPEVISLVRAMETEYTVIYLTARGEEARIHTRAWLNYHAPSTQRRKLFMRARGDLRDDVAIKSEIYHTQIKPYYDVRMALDDNSHVIKWWRSEGIHAWHVAEGIV